MLAKTFICDFCSKGSITKRTEDIVFRQWSDKGYVCVRVMLLVGACDHCREKTFEPQTDKILDEAFQQEYDKLP
jgi:hypothetical protein